MHVDHNNDGEIQSTVEYRGSTRHDIQKLTILLHKINKDMTIQRKSNTNQCSYLQISVRINATLTLTSQYMPLVHWVGKLDPAGQKVPGQH